MKQVNLDRIHLGVINLNETDIYKKHFLEINVSETRVKDTDKIFHFKHIKHNKKSIIKYNDGPNNGSLYRSILTMDDSSDLLCVTPPKSLEPESFINSERNFDKLVCEELVEGTIVTSFYNKYLDMWNVTTNNSVCADDKSEKCEICNKRRTYKDMFDSLRSRCNINFKNVNRNYCYSFMIQHPCHISLNLKEEPTPKLYLIGIYEIDRIPESCKFNIYSIKFRDEIKVEYLSYLFGFNKEAIIFFPQKYHVKSYQELIDKYGSMNTPHNILGAVIYNKTTGNTTKIMNPVYEQIKYMKKISQKDLYQYLSLRKSGKMTEFLTSYPKYKTRYSAFRDNLHLFTDTLYENYLSCYVNKFKKINEFSTQYRMHMINLHKIYLDELMSDKLHVNKHIVIKYVNNLSVPQLFYIMNYSLKKIYNNCYVD